MKEGKTLLLTTHFMEESDALSDRIMIISNGVIKADGTSAKLKEDYGSGKIYFDVLLFNRLKFLFRL
jgi:ABC-2 type transport system ATP-binding protein